MELKVIGAGFGRTGTWSALAALNELGLPCYHMSEVILNKANKSHVLFWRKVANSPPGSQHDWQQVFEKYAATVDFPGCAVWRELRAAYPQAKVLLTLHPRGAEAWYQSVMNTIYFTESMWQWKILEVITPFGRNFGDMVHKLAFQRMMQGVMTDKAKAIAMYAQHIEDVKAEVPSDQLLIFTVDQGWEPLCAFLGLPVPETPFPNINDRGSFTKLRNGIIRGMYVMLGGTVVALGAVGYAVWRWVF